MCNVLGSDSNAIFSSCGMIERGVVQDCEFTAYFERGVVDHQGVNVTLLCQV
eukprot:m.595542 g.595542  ORF g.595542 m.595542 type:complete len:52 (+) comp22405_c0_seq1:1486-1641(+)